MSEHTRTPGRVDEETVPVDGSVSTSNSDYQRSNNSHREPGRVDDPTEVMPDDLVDAQYVGPVGSDLTGRGPWGVVFWVVAINIFIWLSYGASLAITDAWQKSTWIGLLLSIFAAILLVVLFIAGRREYKALTAVDALADRSAQIRVALASDNLSVLRDALEPTLKNLRKRHANRMAEFEDAAKYRETAAEYLEQFENIVLIHLDKEANSAIKRSALVGGTVVAIVPHPSLDAAVALWRATVLIRKIGEIYGLEPTGLSSFRLLKHSISTAIIAAGTSIVVDYTLEQAGQEVFNQVTASIGKGAIEGVVTAGRLYRLGNYAQKLCRPMTT